MTARTLVVGLSLVTLTFAAGACSKEGDSGAPISTEQGCSNHFATASAGTEITQTQLIDGQPGTWALTKVEGFQSVHSKTTESQKVYVGYEVVVDPTKPTPENTTEFNLVCGANDTQKVASFSYKAPSRINRFDGSYTTEIEGDVNALKHSGYEHTSRRNAVNKKMEANPAGAANATKGAIQTIKLIDAKNVEIWLKLPVENNTGSGTFYLKMHYVFNEADPLDLHRGAFAYAYAETYHDGIGMNSDDARNFATNVLAMGQADGYRFLAVHKIAFKYAYAETYHDGLGMTSQESANFANKVAARPDADEVLKKFKTAFKYAYAETYHNGLGMNKNLAVEFAAKVAGIQL